MQWPACSHWREFFATFFTWLCIMLSPKWIILPASALQTKTWSYINKAIVGLMSLRGHSGIFVNCPYYAAHQNAQLCGLLDNWQHSADAWFVSFYDMLKTGFHWPREYFYLNNNAVFLAFWQPSLSTKFYLCLHTTIPLRKTAIPPKLWGVWTRVWFAFWKSVINHILSITPRSMVLILQSSAQMCCLGQLTNYEQPVTKTIPATNKRHFLVKVIFPT